MPADFALGHLPTFLFRAHEWSGSTRYRNGSAALLLEISPLEGTCIWTPLGQRLSPSSTAAEQQQQLQQHITQLAESKELVQYLLSDDTRLPTGVAAFCEVAAPPEAYDSYVGEDLWRRSSSHEGDEAASEIHALPPPPHAVSKQAKGEGNVVRNHALGTLIAWMSRAIEESASGAVRLGGCFSMPTDYSWAVSTNSLRLCTLRDVMLAMRMSTVFLDDLHAQRVSMRKEDRSTNDDGSSLVAMLCDATEPVDGSSFRLFCKVRRVKGMRGDVAIAVDAPCAASQFSVDVLFPHVASWSLEHTEQVFQAMVHRVDRVLPHASQSLLSYVAAYLSTHVVSGQCMVRDDASCSRSATGTSAENDDAVHGDVHVGWLGIDVWFESLSLPILVRSAVLYLHSDHATQPVGGVVRGEEPCWLRTPPRWTMFTSSASTATTTATASSAAHHPPSGSIGAAEEAQRAFFRFFGSEEGLTATVQALTQPDRRLDISPIVIATEETDLQSQPQGMQATEDGCWAVWPEEGGEATAGEEAAIQAAMANGDVASLVEWLKRQQSDG